MENPKCSVENCKNEANYKVFLYDYYAHSAEQFYEQDITCPYLCNSHKEDNEEKAEGVKTPRAYVDYPYTNQHKAQGYTKYEKL